MLLGLLPVEAFAQAPAVGPLLLVVPATPRTAALGNAWVAGRDQDVLFYNPAQLIGARQGLDLSVTRYRCEGTITSLGSVYAAGKWSLTLGWGVQFANYSVPAAGAYPYQEDVMFTEGSGDGTSVLAAVGGAITYKGFRFGATGKYAADRVSTPSGLIDTLSLFPVNHSVFVADIGVARNIAGGVGGFAVQNLGGDGDDVTILSRATLPRQVLMGWSTTKVAGPIDIGVYSQLTIRDDWTSPAGGIEIGYGWIDGYSAAFRFGARRPEIDAANPISLGAALTADRLTIEYGVQFFDGGRASHGVTIRWR
jgi:hypothetical protein